MQSPPSLDAALARFEAGDTPAAARICRLVLRSAPDDAGALHLLGVILNDTGLHTEAANLMGRALTFAPSDASLLFNLGVALRASGRVRNAIWAFRRAVEEDGGRADAWYNLGEASRRLDRLEDAETAFARAVELHPENWEAWFNLANTLTDLARLDEALDAYRQAIRLDPHNAEMHNNLGIALRLAGRADEAIDAFQRAIAISPGNARAQDNLGNALADLKRHRQAISAFIEAIRLVPDYADAHFNLGNVYRDLVQGAEAAICYQTALDIQPENLQARAALGLALHMMGRFPAAEEALSLVCHERPEDAMAWGNLGNLLRDAGDLEGALASLDKGLSLDPDAPRLRANKALALLHAHRLDEAISAYRGALGIEPENEPLRSNLAQALLLAGRLAEGWEDFEARLDEPEMAALLARLPGRRWAGEEIAGKSLLLACEQGLGDAVQFVRYALALHEAGARLAIAAPARLVRLLKSLPVPAEVLAIDAALPQAELNAPLLSLPHLGRDRFDDIPAPSPYLFAEPDLVEQWAGRLGREAGLKIGLAWQGNPAYQGDRARSIPLASLAALTEGGEARFFSLQKEPGRDQLSHLGGGAAIEDLGGELDLTDAFVDSAAVIANLDLVITSDTAIPHLAGALGRPVWMLLPHTPDWRWRLAGTRCPWYPTMRLIRQPAPGDWTSAVARARAYLDTWIAEGGAPNQIIDRENSHI